MTVPEYLEEILRSGLPGIRDLPDRARRAKLDSYREHLQRIFVLDPIPTWTLTFSPLTRLTKNTEHEVDLIVEGDGMRVVAIGVKLAATVDDRDVRHLNWLHSQLGDRVVDRVVVTPGEFAYRHRDSIAVVPLALLGS